MLCDAETETRHKHTFINYALSIARAESVNRRCPEPINTTTRLTALSGARSLEISFVQHSYIQRNCVLVGAGLLMLVGCLGTRASGD